jgi:uncharacterized protein YlxW (UPF0749 family)
MPSIEQIVIGALVIIILALCMFSFSLHTALITAQTQLLTTQTEYKAEITKRDADIVEAKRILTNFTDKLKHFFNDLDNVLKAAISRGDLSQEAKLAISRVITNFKE